ncbi:hypothetical protein VKI22_03830 [Cyanobacterium aponinum UTEX 3221]|uniref:Uncharacterized protein n=1 Tax=Cyanobacterium aponinum (strain PCC 10605) TaxID=755178 RepID=K9Z009_CYAAP|nr:hypothetical protein [Cyanobacterium aponinum]AFZ52541.1 hypothetical protein Cyan10605_0397 [Cyanobacterium aponinum PCC 10605]PHV62345.1 hypothetical protein CSQ80_10865 [Cyanobacterium aponinum IPPAS B-1201]WRL39240.1 hypothetical protein VKI22_03830 [Cyanobacterium aponinum UTEX 3221]
MLVNQFFFLSKVILLSTLISFIIKYGLDNWILEINETFLAIFIISFPVITLVIILLVKHQRELSKWES